MTTGIFYSLKQVKGTRGFWDKLDAKSKMRFLGTYDAWVRAQAKAKRRSLRFLLSAKGTAKRLSTVLPWAAVAAFMTLCAVACDVLHTAVFRNAIFHCRPCQCLGEGNAPRSQRSSLCQISFARLGIRAGNGHGLERNGDRCRPHARKDHWRAPNGMAIAPDLRSCVRTGIALRNCTAGRGQAGGD